MYSKTMGSPKTSMKKVFYDDIVNRFAELGCKLDVTKEDYERDKMHSKSVFKYIATCGHENSSRFKSLKEQPIRVCKACVRKGNQVIVYNRLVERFESLGLYVLTPRDEFIEKAMNVMSDFKFIALCGHERESALYTMENSEHKVCLSCSNQIKADDRILPYEEVESRFLENGLKLITTKEQYDEKRITGQDHIEYRAKCGHYRKSTLGNVIRFKMFHCLECTMEGVRLKLQSHAKNNADTDVGASFGNVLEYKALCYLRESLTDKFEVVKLRNGTLADCVVRPCGCQEDKWLQIQLKTTEKRNEYNEYKFDMKEKDYSGMVVLCTCMSDKRIFWYDGESIKGVRTLRVSQRHDKKVTNELYQDTFGKLLLEKYNEYQLVPLNDTNVPRCVTHQRELEFILIREKNLSFLPFEYSEIENVVYDFKVNGFKVQEKVCQDDIKMKEGIRGMICKNKYRLYGKSIRGPYNEGDNDFYWFHHPNKLCFYILPECLLMKWDKLETEDNEGRRSILLYPYHIESDLENKMTKEANDYLFFYENLDVDKLKHLFNLS